MAGNPQVLGLLEVRAVNSCLVVDVSWGDAEGVQSHLHRRGVRSTLHLDPRTREAVLEIWPGPDEAKVRDSLADWKRLCPSATS